MQYSIHLPEDFDETLIRKRVEARQVFFDELKGLKHKSFLFNADDKLYAPFYIWDGAESARDFLLDDLFKGVIETFNRPRVRNWSILATGYGVNKNIKPKFAVREADLIEHDVNIKDMVEHEKRLQNSVLCDPNAYFHAIALDADRWEFVRYSLWKDEKSANIIGADLIQTYEVLHVSEPKYSE